MRKLTSKNTGAVILTISFSAMVVMLTSSHTFSTASQNEVVQTPKNSTTLHLTVRTDSFVVDSPIIFRTVVDNPTATGVALWTSTYWTNHFLILLDSEGNEPPLTASGRSFKRSFFSPDRDKNFPFVIPSGKSHDEGEHRLTDLFMLKPGDYSLKVLYVDEQQVRDWPEALPATRQEFSLLSNIIKFRVTEAARQR